MKLKYYLYDVFTSKQFGGGQVSVVEIPSVIESKIPDSTLQNIANEFNYPETVFIYSPTLADTEARIRIFTTANELPMAGSPTIGAAHHLKTSLEIEANEFNLDLKIGKTKIIVDDSQNVFMNQQKGTFRNFNGSDLNELNEAFGIRNELIGNSPVEFSSTGLEFLIIPIINVSHLENLNINNEKLVSLLRKYSCDACYLFSEVKANIFSTRMFMEHNEQIIEDPATGSATGALTAYLERHNNIEGKIIDRIKISQGNKMGRPSTIYASIKDGIPCVGGKVIFVGSGQLDING